MGWQDGVVPGAASGPSLVEPPAISDSQAGADLTESSAAVGAAVSDLEDGGAERQLWCAVLGRAVLDATDHVAAIGGEVSRRRIREDARGWIIGNGPDFRTACEAAGYDPDYLRDRLLPRLSISA